MQTSAPLQQMYEELANRYARQGEARQRDHFLVLAADAALSAGQADQAERLRKRLLLTNPHHLLRPFASMTEAMQSTDVQDFVADLRRQWPPEIVEKLVRQTPAAEVQTKATEKPASKPVLQSIPLAPPPLLPPAEKPAKPAKRASPNAKVETPTLQAEDAQEMGATTVGYVVTMVMLVLGIALAGGLLFSAFAAPWLER